MLDQDKILVFTKVCLIGLNMTKNLEIIQLPQSFNYKTLIFDILYEVFGTVDQFLVVCPICTNSGLFVGYMMKNGHLGTVFF